LDTGDLSFARLAAQLADGPVDQAHALVVIMSSLPSLYCATTTTGQHRLDAEEDAVDQDRDRSR
jgi:hypothetical protein